MVRALDLFAGTGWGVAAKNLGIDEYGVEIDKDARATREANGMRTAYNDVWDGLITPSIVPQHDLLIASPPCQTFSAAGKGSGRKALDQVLDLIKSKVYEHGILLRESAKLRGFDDRTALVLAPLAYIHKFNPQYIALEQVPSVLPVWEAYAEVLRDMGYTVDTGILHAEQYGVPQTRKRAILVARRGDVPGEASLPEPTHSKYHSRSPETLDEGVLPWVSMAEALGWGMKKRPVVTLGNATGRGLIGGSGAKEAVVRQMEAGEFIDSPHGDGSSYAEKTRITPEDAGKLQTFPPYVGFPRKSDGREEIEISGEQYRARDLRPGDEPAQTVTEKARSWSVFEGDERRSVTQDEAAVLQSFPPSYPVPDKDRLPNGGTGEWASKRPSPTIVGSFSPDVVAAPGYRKPGDPPRQKTPDSIRVTAEEASKLQSYDEPFVWKGSRTSVFLQIGNAVPPLLAHAILKKLVFDV